MKFSDGTWQSRPGWRLQHPCEIQEYRLEEDSISLLVLCKSKQAPGYLTDATTLEYRFSAPREE